MYADAALLFPFSQGFPPEMAAPDPCHRILRLPPPDEEEFLDRFQIDLRTDPHHMIEECVLSKVHAENSQVIHCILEANCREACAPRAAPFCFKECVKVRREPNQGNLMRISSVLEYDLGGEGDLFSAPEPIIEEPVLELDPMTAAMSITGVESFQDDPLLSDVFYECKKNLMEKSAIEEAFSELSDIKIPTVQTEEMPIAEETRVAQVPMQKSVSTGCLNSMDWVNAFTMRPNFLDFQGLDFETAFGLRRAFSEGDIQTLGNSNANLGSTTQPSFEQLSTISDIKAEERRQKLSRYRKKKSMRNFGRKIKYACRKALADSQPRVRGRFAKTEECEIPKLHY